MGGEISHEERARRAGRIAQARRDAKMTQEELATLAGVDYRSLQSWETGKAAPQVHNLLQVEKALGISYEPGAPPDLNKASPDIRGFLIAFYAVLEPMDPADRADLMARAILTLRE